MTATTAKTQSKNMSSPDEVRTLPKSHIEVVKIGDLSLMRATFEPGWKWSKHIKPTAGADLCEYHHFGYLISGQMDIIMSDGSEATLRAGDVVDIPPGHDSWVVGNEPVVILDFLNAESYAKKQG